KHRGTKHRAERKPCASASALCLCGEFPAHPSNTCSSAGSLESRLATKRRIRSGGLRPSARAVRGHACPVRGRHGGATLATDAQANGKGGKLGVRRRQDGRLLRGNRPEKRALPAHTGAACDSPNIAQSG